MTRRDWANLPTELVERMGAVLLADDVTEYVRLRSVCRPWRSCTDDPKNLGGCFHPRNWIMLTPPNSPPTAAYDFFNLSTGKSFSLDLLELRRGYSLVYVVDGLCLLKNNRTRMLALLNPFTRFLIHLPEKVHGSSKPISSVLECAPGTISGVYITSSSTVVLRFNGDWANQFRLLYAKPGDPIWLSINMKTMISDSLLYRDQFYAIDVNEGLVRINLHRKMNSQSPVTDFVVPVGPTMSLKYKSYLVECDGKIILVNDNSNVTTTKLQMFRVDLEERRLVPITSIDGYALFLASQRSMSVYCKNLLCAHDNVVYVCDQSGDDMFFLAGGKFFDPWDIAPSCIKYVCSQSELVLCNPKDLSDPCTISDDLVRYQKLRSIQIHKDSELLSENIWTMNSPQYVQLFLARNN